MVLTAIFGGTFNPFHIGHYEMLSALQSDKKIDRIFVLPDKIPPHKKCDFMASDTARIEMCRIASLDFPKAELCLLEFEREGKSYTYDTVMLLQKLYPDTDFAFVCGGDMLVYFDKWYNYREVMKLLPFIVFRRSDTDNVLFDECVERFTKMGMDITVKDEVITAVSSTDIRKNFNSSKRFLPEKIHKFLLERGEYGIEH